MEERLMKKILPVIALVLVLALVLVACGETAQEPAPAKEAESTETRC